MQQKTALTLIEQEYYRLEKSSFLFNRVEGLNAPIALPKEDLPEIYVILSFSKIREVFSQIQVTNASNPDLVDITEKLRETSEACSEWCNSQDWKSRKISIEKIISVEQEQESRTRYKIELTQSAACLVAAIEDESEPSDFEPSFDYNSLYFDRQHLKNSYACYSVAAVVDERDRQDKRFGKMPRGLEPLLWLLVIAEELGEAALELIRSERNIERYTLLPEQTESMIRRIAQTGKLVGIFLRKNNLKEAGTCKISEDWNVHNWMQYKQELAKTAAITIMGLISCDYLSDLIQLKNDINKQLDARTYLLNQEELPFREKKSEDLIHKIANNLKEWLNLDEQHSMLLDHIALVIHQDIQKAFGHFF